MPNADSLVCVRLFGMKIPKGCYIIECAFSSCANDNHFTNFGLNELTVYLYCEKVGEVAEALSVARKVLWTGNQTGEG